LKSFIFLINIFQDELYPEACGFYLVLVYFSVANCYLFGPVLLTSKYFNFGAGFNFPAGGCNLSIKQIQMHLCAGKYGTTSEAIKRRGKTCLALKFDANDSN